MGRCRATSRPPPPPPDDDPNLRANLAKRKRAGWNVDILDISSTGQGILADVKVSLYHCNYCNKDVSGKIRIKCVVCQDFDLCVECFSVGAEVTPHKSSHPYRVMDNLSFPLLCPDWNADEEMLLLEGIEMYGSGNWNEVAEYVGTKSKSQCIDHYNAVYMNSPCFPLPDMSHVMGKSREELLASAKGREVKKEFPPSAELTLKEEPPFSEGINSEESKMVETTNQTMSKLSSVCSKTYSSTIKKASNISQNNDGVKVEEPQVDRSIGEKKPKLSAEDRPSMTELSGYNFKREEFDIEYDNDAEQTLAEMEFKDTDTDSEREVKLQVLRIYLKRLNERKRRKDFVLERNFLSPDPFEKSLSAEELEICQHYKVFMRFHSKEEHKELLKNIIEEHRLVKRIKDLQEARTAGCRTAAEAYQFVEDKRTKVAEQSASKESGQIGTTTKILGRPNSLKGDIDSSPQGLVKGTTGPFSGVKDSPAIQAISNSLEEWDISDFTGAELLSESEKKLCNEIRILPSHYLNMLQIMSLEISKGNVTKKSDAHKLFKVDPSKVDRVYDMLLSKGLF
ncbi:PREDICTED: transcriptional adapter ADA2b-like isoform X2 [Lupinus angustifolius]|uniref:transcriptional adapter ADA2b-like isoform X2 n=1 Tax=Lupinus angustifolius TaxID=3871 RepID=UPI00092E42CA|nr:PREDICTED: transcriptional adapter ADA2b-like isoform X2 [Lupinus angustifolius]